jgi:arylsulfatase A-like enzyme
MIARWPSRIAPAQICATPAAAWDFMATFADLAGTPPPALTDGISLVPTLLGQPDRQQARDFLYWEFHQGKQQAVRMGPWKGLRIGGIREPIELYNLETNIGETTDVAGSHPELVKKISDIKEQSRANSEFNRFWPLPEHRLNHLQPDKHIFDQIKAGITR